MRWCFLVAATVTAFAAVAEATVRCRTGDGRIYIGPEPPAGCEVEATYAPSAPTAATPPTPRRPPSVRAEPPPRAKPTAREAPRRVAKATPEPRTSRARRAATPAPKSPAAAGAPAGLAEKRERLERSLDRVLLELGRVERRILAHAPPAAAASSSGTDPVRLRTEEEHRRELEPLRRRQGELRARRDRIRAEFAELTSRVGLANGGSLPEWWPPELRCGRCP